MKMWVRSALIMLFVCGGCARLQNACVPPTLPEDQSAIIETKVSRLFLLLVSVTERVNIRTMDGERVSGAGSNFSASQRIRIGPGLHVVGVNYQKHSAIFGSTTTTTSDNTALLKFQAASGGRYLITADAENGRVTYSILDQKTGRDIQQNR